MGMTGNLIRISNDELNSFLQESALLEKKIYGEENINNADLDKAWCGIFYLLTGCEMAEFNEAQAPLSYTLFSEQLVDEDQNLGYGPAHYVTPAQVKEVHAALLQIPVASLLEKYDAEDMNDADIYPQAWDDDGREYIAEHFRIMKDFYQQAAENNEAVITYIS
jgi:hypothetical protein